VTPVDPVGAWRPAVTGTAARGIAGTLGGFDPFFRSAAGGEAGAVVVTSLSLKLFGVRQNQATGRGAAIIALPDGQQRSVGVGEEIMPGVRLDAVGFDNVTISRGGAQEQLFMDQSQGTPAAGGTAAPVGSAVPAPATAPPPLPVIAVPPPAPAQGGLGGQISLQPRLNGGQVTGIVLSPEGTGEAFRAAGLQPGDVLLSVGGQRITSAAQLAGLRDQLAAPGASVQVERGGRVTRIQLRNSQ
jgi:general secretion pathway protein C